jgi:hypothetical protein
MTIRILAQSAARSQPQRRLIHEKLRALYRKFFAYRRHARAEHSISTVLNACRCFKHPKPEEAARK